MNWARVADSKLDTGQDLPGCAGVDTQPVSFAERIGMWGADVGGMTTTLNKADLTKQFAGVTSPSEMGTTGLIAWVLGGKERNRWHRFKIARRVIAKRGLDVKRFAMAVYATGKLYGINLNRFAAATRLVVAVASVESTFTPGCELAEANEMDAKHPGWDRA